MRVMAATSPVEQARNVVGGRFTLDGGIGCQNHFLDPERVHPCGETVQGQIFRTHPVDRRQPAIEDEVAAAKAAGLFNRQYVRGRLHHAQELVVPVLIGAQAALTGFR